jgi:hypothetical protein
LIQEVNRNAESQKVAKQVVENKDDSKALTKPE